MAKKKASEEAPEQQGMPNPETGVEKRVEEFAEDLGRLLGAARAKAEGWIGQRQNVAKQLEQIRDTAGQLLHQLTEGGNRMAAAVVRSTRGRPKGSRNQEPGDYQPAPASKRKRRKLSVAARKAISDAQKKRWAKQRREAQK